MTRLSGRNDDESSFKHSKFECLQDISVRIYSRQTYRDRTQRRKILGVVKMKILNKRLKWWLQGGKSEVEGEKKRKVPRYANIKEEAKEKDLAKETKKKKTKTNQNSRSKTRIMRHCTARENNVTKWRKHPNQ